MLEQNEKRPVSAGRRELLEQAQPSTQRAARLEFSRAEAKRALHTISFARPEGVRPQDWAPHARTRLLAGLLIDNTALRFGVARNRRPFSPGCVFLSIDTMAARLWLDRSSIKRSLRVLELVGFVNRKAAGGGRGQSTLYELSVGWKEPAKLSSDEQRIAEQEAEIERLRDELNKPKDMSAPSVHDDSAELAPAASSWSKRAIVEAYKQARLEAYGVGQVDRMKKGELNEYALFVERMSRELSSPKRKVHVRELAPQMVNIYFSMPGKDHRLREAKHPLAWMIYDQADIEEELRRRRRSKPERVKRAVVEAPKMSKAEELAIARHMIKTMDKPSFPIAKIMLGMLDKPR